jgi:hypothetical protein
VVMSGRYPTRSLAAQRPAARHEPAVMAVDVSEGPDPVVLQFEQPVGMIERFGDAHERPRTEAVRRLTDPGHEIVETIVRDPVVHRIPLPEMEALPSKPLGNIRLE